MTHWVEKYIGTEYGDGPGQRKCWGLVQDVYLGELNIVLDDFRPVAEGDFVDAMRVSRTFKRELLRWAKVDRPREFDVVVMAGYAQDSENCDRLVRAPLHAGVMVGSDKILHIESGRDATCVLLDHWTVRQRILAFCRHEKLVQVDLVDVE
jgi:hypothetical protein